MPFILINNEKIKYPEKVAHTFNSFFLTVAGSLNLHQEGKNIEFLFQMILFLLNPLVLKLSQALKLRLKL